jgi:nucleoside-triphosphatase THEP1
MVVIITGERGAGKTTVCQALVEMAKQQSLRVEGVISPVIFSNGVKTGIQVENAATGERRMLACLNGDNSQCELQTSHWAFDPDATLWGSQILEHSGDCDMLIVDELGPLELEQQRGWVEGISALNRMKYRMGVVVIRPELIEKAKKLWPDAEVFTVSGENHLERLRLYCSPTSKGDIATLFILFHCIFQ